MNSTQLPDDLDDWPLWRLIVLLDDLEREHGAASLRARTVARAVAKRLGVLSVPDTDGEEVPHVAR
jgi:hypothetical protein